MAVYIVKRVYGCGWKCSKGSFSLDYEMDEINENMIVAVLSTKSSALHCAYLKTMALYDEMTQDDEEKDNVNLYLDTTSDTEIEKWLESMQEKLVHDDLYYWYEVKQWNMN